MAFLDNLPVPVHKIHLLSRPEPCHRDPTSFSDSRIYKPVREFSFNMFSDFQTWWVGHDQKYAQFSINGTEFATFPMKNGFNKGDIIFITGARPENIKVGDIIVYNTGINPSPIIHRVIDIRQENGSYVFSTIGDNNWEQFSANQSIYVNPTKIDEINIDSDQIVGVARLKIAPYLGWVKLIFYGLNGGLCRES